MLQIEGVDICFSLGAYSAPIRKPIPL